MSICPMNLHKLFWNLFSSSASFYEKYTLCIQRASQVVLVIKHMPAMQETQERRVPSLVRKMPWKRKWQPIPVFLPGKFHAQRSLAGKIFFFFLFLNPQWSRKTPYSLNFCFGIWCSIQVVDKLINLLKPCFLMLNGGSKGGTREDSVR